MASKRSFEFRSSTSSKLWEVEARGSTLVTTFGKIGAAGQRSEKMFGSAAAATKAADALIEEKRKKGYVATGAGAKAPAAKAPAAKAKAKAKDAPAAKAKDTPAAKAKTPAPADGTAMDKAIAKLDRALRAYAPARHASIKGARDFENDLRGETGMRECAVGAAFAAKQVGHKTAKKLGANAAEQLDEELDDLTTTLTKVRAMSPAEAQRANDLPQQLAGMDQQVAELTLLRAAVAAIAGDAAAARRLLDQRARGPKDALGRHEGIPAVLAATLPA